jgi:hypothetical protein
MNTVSNTISVTTGTQGARGWLETVRRAIASAIGSVGLQRQTLPEGAAQLLARADAYGATQPGYAADLRVCAQRVIDAR